MKSAIYAYSEPREVLAHLYQTKKSRNSLFSIRAWSKRLGFRNPSLLSDMLNGRRRISTDFALRISEDLDLTNDEKKYFQALVFYANAKTESEREFFETVIHRMKPEPDTQVVSIDDHPQLTDWYYGVLDEMPCLRDFKQDYGYLAKRLGSELTPQAVELALRDMLRVGMLKVNGKGRITRPRYNTYRPNQQLDKPMPMRMRQLKRKFTERALAAIDEQSVGESHFRVANLPVKEKDLPRIFELIDDFVIGSREQYECTEDADEVFCLNVGFYRVTEKVPGGSSE